MESITWIPGTNPEFDQLFDTLRIQQYNNKSHRLWKNYGPDIVKSSIALTICFDDDDQPEICSSIAYKDCWPTKTYRILNRLWKTNDHRKSGAPGLMSTSFGSSALSQIEWLNNNIDYKLYFLSRETSNWETFAVRQFARFGIKFETTEYRYLTCPNECDDSCWQNIVYHGDGEILNQWKRR
jgi:hypothetical protein